MTFVIAAGSAWALLALPIAVLVGRGVRAADEALEAPFRVDGVERYLREQASAPLS